MRKNKSFESEEGPRAAEKIAATEQFEKTADLLGPDLYDNPFMITRSGLLAKVLFLNDIYSRIKNVPGDIIEIGVWLGQSLILFENLRAIHEPFNCCRSIYGFDTFEGYAETSGLNLAPEEIQKYAQPDLWEKEIQNLFEAHCSINNSQTNLTLIKGDVRETLTRFSESYTGLAACIYLDIATQETTDIALAFAKDHLVKGGVLIVDDYGDVYPGVMKSMKKQGIEGFECELNPHFKTKLLLWKQ